MEKNYKELKSHVKIVSKALDESKHEVSYQNERILKALKKVQESADFLI